MKALDSNSNVGSNSNELQADVNRIGSYIEDLGQVKEVNLVSHTMVKGVGNDVTLQPRTQGPELVESLSATHFSEVDIISSNNKGENGSPVGQNEELGINKIDDAKRPEDECKTKESSVCVVYSSLPRQSKRKLEELLHQWSEWHAQHFTSADDLADCLESGEETYFPALRVGSEKSLAVSFSMDVHVQKRQRQESSSLNNDCSPLYDRGYAVGLESDEGIAEERVVDLREAPRCFNCGSFNHPLSECQKPRNIAAVNSARKQYLNKKNQSTGPRVQTRYYQESPGGKFDGLKPGALSAETRKLLGLAELDPPPWLNRMRELGYPLGYLDSEEEDPPSGIAIFGDEEIQNVDVKNGLSLDARKSQKKMTVDFPGINASIPKNADQKNWTAYLGQSPDNSSNQTNNRWNDVPGINAAIANNADQRSWTASVGRSPANSWNQLNDRWNDVRERLTNGLSYGGYGPRNYIEAQSSPSGLGLSPSMPHYPHNYPPREPFSPRDGSLPGSPHYGRPGDGGRPFMLHYNYGSL